VKSASPYGFLGPGLNHLKGEIDRFARRRKARNLAAGAVENKGRETAVTGASAATGSRTGRTPGFDLPDGAIDPFRRPGLGALLPLVDPGSRLGEEGRGHNEDHAYHDHCDPDPEEDAEEEAFHGLNFEFRISNFEFRISNFEFGALPTRILDAGY
jgi:hypothetical protein